MPKHVFQLLARLVGHIREQPECRNIDKIIIPKTAHIAGKSISAHSDFCRPLHILRQSQRNRKVIRASRRNIPQGYSTVALHQTGHRLVERSVPTAADHQVIRRRMLHHKPRRITLCLCGIDRYLIPRAHHNLQNIRELRLDLPYARMRIIYK